MTSPQIETVISFLAGQMDGEIVPPHNAAPMRALASAIKALHQKDSALEFHELGLRALGLAIDRARSGIKAEAALLAFIERGAGHGDA